jgi:hypothetical protein
MKTPAELIHDADTALHRMANECEAIHDYATLLGVVLAGPDADTAMEGMRRIALIIRGMADDLRSYHDDAMQAVQRLAKP